MASGYKLRLGDGTTMLVDDKGLATWLQNGLVDDKARVQPAGSRQWLTIRQLMIAVERATRERQAEQERLSVKRRAAEEQAEAERRAAEEQVEAERRADEEQAALGRLDEERVAAERLAAEEQAARESRAEKERLAAERRAARERAEAERLAKEEQAAVERLAEERVAAERLAAEEQAARESRAEKERLAAERRAARERAEAERQADQERAARARRESEPREVEIETLELEPLPEAEREEDLPEAEFEDPDVSAADLGLVPVEFPVPDERAELPPPPVGRAERRPAPAPTFSVLEGRASLLEALKPGWHATAERVRSLARWPRSAAVPRPPVATPSGEMPDNPSVPPPSLRDLPVIPLAEMDEPTGDDDAQGGWLDGLRAAFLESRAAEIAPRLWVWCKRVTITAALLVIVAVLASNTSVWLPATTEVGIALFGQVDKVRARVAPPTLPAAAVAAASEQLPHLRTETIELIMVNSAHRALEPPQLFRLAGDAVERGRAALDQPAAAELDRLTEALTAELPRAERLRLGEYLKRVRARAVTAPFEDREAVWLMARAARRLPAERLARLQDLFARAAALGLQPTAAATD